MRVLLIDVNCKYSSTGKIVYNLCQFLNAHGHEAAVAYGRGEEIDEPGIFKFGIDNETRMHALLARITGYNGRFSPKSTARLLDFIEEFNPDVIHIHELHAYFVNHRELLEYIKSKHIPVVWTFHCEYMYTGK
ncbi:MAG: glycosyltransferase, partial [Pseudobutyrivibrio sp.]|nr:glycosyltransferase [Pseudobutyrivibrio sp.]